MKKLILAIYIISSVGLPWLTGWLTYTSFDLFNIPIIVSWATGGALLIGFTCIATIFVIGFVLIREWFDERI